MRIPVVKGESLRQVFGGAHVRILGTVPVMHEGLNCGRRLRQHNDVWRKSRDIHVLDYEVPPTFSCWGMVMSE
jgi:hypothetical protein